MYIYIKPFSTVDVHVVLWPVYDPVSIEGSLLNLVFQVVRRFWSKNDMRGAVEAMKKMTDQSVSGVWFLLFLVSGLGNALVV